MEEGPVNEILAVSGSWLDKQHLLRLEGLEDGVNRFMGMKSIIELENGYVWYSEIAVGERRDPFGGGDEKSGESVKSVSR